MGRDHPVHPIGARRPRDFTLRVHARFRAQEAEYTDAACVPYPATALDLGEESIYELRILADEGSPTVMTSVRHPPS